MKCEFCGIELDKDTKVCTECGFTASRPVMTEKSHHVIGAEKQKEIKGNLSKREYKINQSSGFSNQNVKEKVKPVEKPKKKADLQKNQGPVQPPKFMVQGQSAESAEQVQKKNSEQHYIGQNQQRNAPQKQFKYTMPSEAKKIEKPQMTRKEFFNYRGVKNSKNLILASVILLYLDVSFVLLADVILKLSLAPVIHIVLVLIVLFMVQFKQKFSVSVYYGIYTVINYICYFLIFPDWKSLLFFLISRPWPILAAALAISGTYKFNKQWELYLKTGFFPDER